MVAACRSYLIFVPAQNKWKMAANGMELYDRYVNTMRKITDIRRSADVLQWDQETYLPKKSAAIRGRQIATLTETAHQLFSDDDLGKILEDLTGLAELTEDQQKNIERTRVDYLKNKKYSSAFVRTLSEQVNKTFHTWINAREMNSFSIFEKELDKLIQLKKQESEILGYESHPYNAHLNEYEKGCTVKFLDEVFDPLLPFLNELLNKIKQQPAVDNSFLQQHFPKQSQWEWGMYIIQQLGFDFEAGRQDISEHPFTTSFGPTDVRLTTRIDENDFANMTWSCIHEAGHGLYEQGLPLEQYGLPLGEYCSLGIHESQSRLWENNVGRSEHFWKYYYPKLQEFFPDQFKTISPEIFYKGINKVEPGLIRTEADELTYHFHVFIRYEWEKKLFEGTLHTADIPAFWNEMYFKYLGIKVPDDKNGCLQDVHWSHGSFGYFPTYSLGSLYAAQFYSHINNSIPNLDIDLENGITIKILQWLQQYIYPTGRKYTSNELCLKVTGESLNAGYFKDHLLRKFGIIYNL